MTIKLTTAAEHQLILGLTEGIRKLHVRDGLFLDSTEFGWVKGLADALPEDARNKLYRYCGDDGLAQFVKQWLYSILKANYDYSNTKSLPLLTSYPEFSDAFECARLIVEEIKGLPHRFRITAPLPRAFSQPIRGFVTNHRLSPHISIVSGDNLPQPFPLGTGNPRIDKYLFSDFLEDAEYDASPKEDRLYLTACVLGSMDYLSTPIIAQDFEDIWRALYGASLAMGLLDRRWLPEEDRISYLSIHEEDEFRQIVDTKKVDSDIQKFNFRAGTDTLVKATNASTLEAVCKYLNGVAIVFDDTMFARRLFTASIWYFRSVIAPRPLDQLLESTIAIEVMLGDRETSELVGISKLLGNRCAYLLARTPSERDEIVSDFGRIYRLRSSIVHSGKHKLESDDRKVVASARKLCARILAHEIALTTGHSG